ncbi:MULTISPECIES: hypothetical protein [unclassified Bradyrhizobium]|uniref:hypothetical protein n=1 Tax=unclassified Bradyrhizobium TaxID=2631580 RepID=UPI002916C47C|nr:MULTISPECIES: hypothetical protein [unclassified Bradyrhizobium]
MLSAFLRKFLKTTDALVPDQLIGQRVTPPLPDPSDGAGQRPPAARMSYAQAVRVIAQSAGQIAGAPTSDRLDQAWASIPHPISDYVRALVGLSRTIPIPMRSENLVAWTFSFCQRAQQDVETVVEAIWAGVVLQASQQVADVLARRIEHRLNGAPANVVYPGGPPATRECHVTDERGRPLIARIYEHGPGGRLQILDEPGGYLSTETCALSGWNVVSGWVAVGPLRLRRNANPLGEAQPALQPRPGRPN